jgi:hypothetical protein
MSRWKKQEMRWKRYGFDPKGASMKEHFDAMVGQHMTPEPYNESSSRFLPARMREDMIQANLAANFSANLRWLVNEYLHRDGNLEDAYEILSSHISERGFLKIAKEKFGMRDVLDDGPHLNQ